MRIPGDIKATIVEVVGSEACWEQAWPGKNRISVMIRDLTALACSLRCLTQVEAAAMVGVSTRQFRRMIERLEMDCKHDRKLREWRDRMIERMNND